MKNLYEIIEELQVQGSNAKASILQGNKDNKLLQLFLKAVYDPSLSYYISKSPNPTTTGLQEFTENHLNSIVETLAERKLTGNAAKKFLLDLLDSLDKQGQELVRLLISRNVSTGVGDGIVLKVFPDLYFVPFYQRCSLLDAKAKEKFSKLPLMYAQEKCDGSFLYLVKEAGKAPEAITRAGSKYPREFAEKLAEGVPEGVVLIGELLVYAGDNVLDRQTGNGMLNSILKGGDVDTSFEYKMKAWDIVSPEEFKVGKSEETYIDRLTKLFYMYDSHEPKHVQPLKNKAVRTLEEAYKLYSDFTAQGKEGAVLKTPDFLWKDGTSKDCVKMKVEFEIDLEITGVVEGSGKATGMMGALQLKSSCGGLVTDVGTGFDDATRKQFWQGKDELVGMIVAVKANDIISKRDRGTKSLFLPVFLECRVDKKIADSLEDCERILMAAKGLK